jgi:hypothetical protein
MEHENTSATTVVVGFLIISILIGISFFIIFRNNETRKIDLNKAQQNLTLENKTNLLYTVKLPSSQNIDVEPHQKIQFAISTGDTINAMAYNYDKTISKYDYRLPNNPKIKKLYIGNSGIVSNIDASENIIFVNESSYPVLFIEKSIKGGKRWVSDIVLSKSQTEEKQFVSKRSMWQVCHPTDEERPISEINIGRIPSRIVFDGKSLKAF